MKATEGWRFMGPGTWCMVANTYRYWYTASDKRLSRENVRTGAVEAVACRSLPMGNERQSAARDCAGRFYLARTRGYLIKQRVTLP